MRCPYCKHELVLGEQKRYETVVEHCIDPNLETHPLRDTWICLCVQAQNKFWDDAGDGYGQYNLYPALDSFAHQQMQIHRLSARIRPWVFWAKYPYDLAYNIARKIIVLGMTRPMHPLLADGKWH